MAHYLEVKERLLANGAAEIRLSTNFRSVPAICDFVNRVMKPVFEEAPGIGGLARQVDYVPLHPRSGTHPGERSAGRDSARSRPLCPPARGTGTEGGGGLRGRAHRQRVPGFPSRQRGDPAGGAERHLSAVPALPDVWTAGAAAYADALRDLDIAHSLAAVQTYIGSAELSFLRAALTAIEFPEDELSVYATLRGPLFAIPTRTCSSFGNAIRKSGSGLPGRAFWNWTTRPLPEAERPTGGGTERGAERRAECRTGRRTE